MNSQQAWSASFASASVSAMQFYDDIMVPRLFEPWAELLLDELNPQRGDDVLDVACGPGTVSRRAARRVGDSGRVTGCDLSPAMLDLARSKISERASATIEYSECSANALSVPDDAFDVVTCQQGLQFFPDRPKALAEMRRALRPGGQMGIAVWCAIEDCPPFAALADALGSVLGAEIKSEYEHGPWGFGDAEMLSQLVRDCGFTNVRLKRHELPLVFDGGPGQLLLTLRTTSVATTLAALPEEDQVAIAAALDEATRPFTSGGVIESHATSHILIAEVGDKLR